MFSRNVSLSDLFYMTDEELESRDKAVQDFNRDMCVNDNEKTVSVDNNVNVPVEMLTQKRIYKHAMEKKIADVK